MTGWTDEARAAILRVHAALPEGATRQERKRALRAAYPFGARSGWPYKAWCREQKKYLARFPDLSKLKESPLFRAARGLAAERPKRKAVMSYRGAGTDVDGRYILFRCPRCRDVKRVDLTCEEDKLVRHPCGRCNGGSQ